ncbi:MAG TPA: GNAT family N-acetyltransferase, partial [Pyrinomonadaceae bacterium]|nr:GNAT family N-acetyltransferase [Pyrinomonadaceae bacterium]
VINAAFRIAEGFFIDGNRITLEELRQHLTTGVFLVAESEETITGCVYLELRGERAYLGLLSVDPLVQQSGLGSRLMTAGEEYCRARGARFMDIYIVNLRTELPAFYRNRGYVETGATPFPADVQTKQP